MLHNGRVRGAGGTILIPIDRYPQVFSMTHLVILPYVIRISCFSPLYPYSQPFTRPAISSAAARQHVAGHRSSDRRGIPGRLSSLFRRNNYNAHDTTPRPRLLEGVLNPFSRTPRRRHHEGMELQEHRPTVVDVPFTRGNPVSPPSSISDVRLYICHIEKRFSGTSPGEER